MSNEPFSRSELLRREGEILREGLREARTDPAGQPLETQLKALANVRALLEAQRAILAKRRQQWLSGVVLCTAAAVLACAAIRVRSVQVDIRALASRVAMTSRGDQNLTGLLALGEVALLGRFTLEGPADLQLPSEASQLKLTAGADPIVMEPIDLTAGDRVALERTAEPGRYRLEIDSEQPKAIAFSVAGRVQAATGRGSADAHVTMARQVVATWTGGERATITFTTKVPALTKPMSIGGLELKGLETVGSVPRPVSTVTNGELRFPGYANRVVSIREHEPLEFAGLDGVISSIVVKDRDLSIDLAATATGIELGGRADRHSVVPTVLEKMTKQADWVMVTGALGALFATLWSMWMNPR